MANGITEEDLIKACRTRRVKCDEAKPTCLRCSRSGYQCDGYTVSRRCRETNLLLPKSCDLGNEGQVALLHFPRTGVSIQPSSSIRFETDIQHQHFIIFQTKTAPELTGYFDSTVWNRKVLQACHDQEYARHAVVALGALWRAQDISQTTPNLFPLSLEGCQEAKALYTFALKEYGTAIRLMREITKQQDPERLRNTLMSSLLTTCFESYIGNQELALSQAETGVDVLLEWSEECQTAPYDDWTSVKRLQHKSTFLDDDIVGVFARMDFQVMTFRDRSKAKYRTRSFPKIPVLFTSINEARLYWDLIIRRVFIWHTDISSRGSVTLDFTEINYQDDPEQGIEYRRQAAKEANNFKIVTKDWYQAFLHIFERTRRYPGTKEYLAASSLMLRYIPSKFKVAPERRDYVRVVELAREILETDSRSSVPGRSVFTFETTVVVGLLMVATTCRQVAVRRQAIDLLQEYPRREGLVDSMMVVKIASWMLDQEANDVVDGNVPKSSKLRIVKNDFDLKERKAVLHCSKGDDYQTLLPPVTLWW